MFFQQINVLLTKEEDLTLAVTCTRSVSFSPISTRSKEYSERNRWQETHHGEEYVQDPEQPTDTSTLTDTAKKNSLLLL